MLPKIPSAWKAALADTVKQPWYAELAAFVDAERAAHEVYPPQEDLYAALRLTALDDVKVLILGQDPYHGPGQAHGLAFSVRPDVPIPASLRNIHKELQADLQLPKPRDGSLVPWARHGVLLLNAVLTVRAGEPNSHRDRGWERFTDDVIRAVSAKEERVVFVLWGAYAQKKAALVDTSRHVILAAAHPSPLAARKGFFGSRPFSKANAALRAAGRSEVDWRLPSDAD